MEHLILYKILKMEVKRSCTEENELIRVHPYIQCSMQSLYYKVNIVINVQAMNTYN